MTFAEFQTTGRDVADLSTVEGMDGPEGVAGRVYCDCLYIEDTATWEGGEPGPRWYVLIGTTEHRSDDLAAVEAPLYQFACDEEITSFRHREEYRGFDLVAWEQRGGSWYGLGKGLGTVILPNTFPTLEGVLADMRRRIDLGYERGLGVFAGK